MSSLFLLDVYGTTAQLMSNLVPNKRFSCYVDTERGKTRDQLYDLRVDTASNTVATVVASDTRDPQFKSSHRQNITLNICLKKKIKEKEAGNGPFK